MPLCVDLDDTLIKTDLLAESLLLLLKAAPWTLLWWPAWLWRGGAHFKRRVAERVQIAPETLPYDAEFLDFLCSQKQAGRTLVLATASDRTLASGVARHLGLFADVVASDGVINISGAAKLAALQEKFRDGFDYAGDSRKDLAVWRGARRAIVVRAGPGLTEAVRRITTVERVFEPPAGRCWAAALTLRPHQWAKNFLLFIPLVTSHEIVRAELVMTTLRAMIAFSLCASGVYVLNDLLDLASDRAHPIKRGRPLASGVVPIIWGPMIMACLLAAAAVLSIGLSARFQLAISAYFLITLTYSLRLKGLLLVDVFCLAGLYTLRILAGHAVTDIPLSPWLLAFAMFIFLSLALLKRYIEVAALSTSATTQVSGRDYVATDAAVLMTLGAASGYLSILVLALYINSDQVVRLYKNPSLLWLICLTLLYAVSRLWVLASRGQVGDDPVLFGLKDKVSYAAVALTLVVLTAASR